MFQLLRGGNENEVESARSWMALSRAGCSIRTSGPRWPQVASAGSPTDRPVTLSRSWPQAPEARPLSSWGGRCLGRQRASPVGWRGSWGPCPRPWCDPCPQRAPPCGPNIPTPLVEGSGCALPSARAEVRTSRGLGAAGSPVRTPAPHTPSRRHPPPTACPLPPPSRASARFPCESRGLGHSVPSSGCPQGPSVLPAPSQL